MIAMAGYSRWKRAVTCGWMCRPLRCIAALVTRADTSPTELSIALFLTVYGLRMHFGGVGYWADGEYALIAGQLGVPVSVWPVVVLALGVSQFASLFSTYPKGMWSRLLRIVTTGIAVGGMWIFIRTQGVRGGH